MSERRDGTGAWPAGLGFALGAGLAHRLPELPAGGWLLLLGVVAAAGVLLPRGGRAALGRAARAWCGWVGLGFAWAAWLAALALADRLDPAWEGRDLRLQGTVAEMPRLYGNSTGFELRVHAGWHEGRRVAVPSRVRLTRYRSFGGGARPAPLADPDGIAAGAALEVVVRLKRPYALANPDLFDGELRLLQEGVGARGYVRSLRLLDPAELSTGERLAGWLVLPEIVRAHVRAAMQGALAGRGARETGILVALAVGDQGAIGARDWALFNRTGVGHLMSISGLHVTMIAGLGMLLGARLWHLFVRLPPLGEQLTLQRTRWLGAAATATAYCMLAGWGVPAQRTLFMVIAAGIALLFGRGRSVLQVLSFAAGVVTLADPWASLSAGFWLSFGAVGALLWSADTRLAQTSSAALTLRARLVALLAAAGRTQVAVTVALVPLGAVFFGSTSLTGVLANAFAIPVVTFIVTPLALAGAALAAPLPALAAWPLELGAMTVTATLWLLDALDRALPFPWVIPVPAWSLLAAAVLGCAWAIAPAGVPGRALGLLLVAPLVVSTPQRLPAGTLTITALDVGQGSAVVVRTADLTLLFDAGPAYGGELDAGRRIIVPWLRARGIRALDLMVVSHLDTDHAGGAQSVLEEHPVRRLMASAPARHALLQRPRATACRRGEAWNVGATRLEMLHPPARPETRHRSPTNARSCVLRVSTAGGSVLLTGDIEAAQEQRLVELYADGLRSAVLVAPHHGSGTSSSASFIEAVAPAVAIVQAGYRNRFRHPQRAVVQRYERAGVRLLRTDRDGAIEVRLEPGRAAEIDRYRWRDRRYWRLAPPAE